MGWVSQLSQRAELEKGLTLHEEGSAVIENIPISGDSVIGENQLGKPEVAPGMGTLGSPDTTGPSGHNLGQRAGPMVSEATTLLCPAPWPHTLAQGHSSATEGQEQR